MKRLREDEAYVEELIKELCARRARILANAEDAGHGWRKLRELEDIRLAAEARPRGETRQPEPSAEAREQKCLGEERRGVVAGEA